MSLRVITCQGIIFYMKRNNAMKICGFRASATNVKLKKGAQTKVPDDLQAVSVLYMTQLDAIPQHTAVVRQWCVPLLGVYLDYLKCAPALPAFR